MAKDNSSKTIWIIVAVVLGVLIIGGLIFGFGIYYLYKAGTAVVASPSPTTNLQTGTLSSYANARYGFSMKYPSTFSAQESQNGDGVTLTSISPAITIRAYGSMNALSQNLDEYLNFARDNLFKESAGAEESAATETTLGGLPAQERRWQYVNSVDGTQTIMDQVTALKGDSFYTVQMVIAYSDYSQYAPMFDEILKSFKFE